MLVAAVVTLALAGCGGGAKHAATTTQAPSGKPVLGTGFVFRAPSAWKTSTTPTSATARGNAATLVSVTVLPLVKPYRPQLFPRVVGELDRVANTLAARLKGKVVARRTATLVGRKVRQYDIAHEGLVDRLTFLLRAKREYLLTCRWRTAKGAPAACDRLLASFRFR